MTKIDIISGFLGAGKTTLIKKLINEVLKGQKIVLIENEFGEIGIDGGFLKEAQIEITEMNSGCICCSLAGDFGQSLKEVIEKYNPDRIIIEPSGVGKLSDVIKAVKDVAKTQSVELNSFVTVADVIKYKMYSKNFGEFFLNQIENAGAIFLSRTQNVKEDKLVQCVEALKKYNKNARIVTTPWSELTGKQILDVMEGSNEIDIMKQIEHEHEECCGHHHHEHKEHGECCGHHHHHEHKEHGECCGHHHHHEHKEHGECCGHHHHKHKEHGECCGHHHHHKHEEHGECCGHHHHHEHHHADEVFQSWGIQTPKKFTKEQISDCLKKLEDESLGIVLRAKGIVACSDCEKWIHFDYVPQSPDIREGDADYTSRICVIGTGLDEKRLSNIFGV